MTKLFVDTNVFLYAIGGEGPYREHCRALLAAIAGGAFEGVTNSEVLQEILHVRSRRTNRTDATKAAREAAGVVYEVLPVASEDVLLACDILDKNPNLGARDALHVAVMKRAHLTLLVSVDRDFDVIKSLKRLTPAEAVGLA